MFEGSRQVKQCPKCAARYLAGTPHICANNDRAEAEKKLERFLGDFTVEHE